MPRIRSRLLAIATALLLAACGGAPGDADIKAAIDRSQAESHSPVRLLDKAMKAKLTAVKAVDCRKEKEGAAHVCDVQLTVETTNPFTGKVASTTTTEKLRLVKTDQGWAVSN